MATFNFAPSPTQPPKGYSHIEDEPRWLEGILNERRYSEKSSGDAASEAFQRFLLDQLLDSQYAQSATTFVKPWVAAAYHSSPAGKTFVDKVASMSLHKSVQAINQVSRISRTHRITNIGYAVLNNGRVCTSTTRGRLTETRKSEALLYRWWARSETWRDG
jgi:hypothetical protein